MATRFLVLLWGELQVGLLLRLADPPASDEIKRRAERAVAALLLLYPEPVSLP